MNLSMLATMVALTAGWAQQDASLLQQPVPGAGGNWTQVTDSEFNIAFRMPPQWQIRSAAHWRDGGDPATTVNFSIPASEEPVALYYRLWKPPVGPNQAEIDRYLASCINSKVSQRLRGGFTAYHARAGSAEARQIGNYRALSVVADYLNGAQPMVEYVTWVYGGNSIAFFFAKTSPGKLAELREAVEPLIQSLRLP